MPSLTASAAALITLAVIVCPPSLRAQKPDTLIARPGNGVVKGFLLTPARRQFAVLALPCEADTPTVAHKAGFYFEHTELVGDTLLLIQEWHWLDRAPVFDTTGYDHSTLGALWSHAHAQNWLLSWGFRGPRVSWFSQQPSGERESLDSTLNERAFLAGSTNLLIPVTPQLYVPNALVRFSFIDLAEEPGGKASLILYNAGARVTGSETVTISSKRLSAWIVTVDEPPGGRTYWIEKHSHEVLMWQVPEYESICPQKYVRSSP